MADKSVLFNELPPEKLPYRKVWGVMQDAINARDFDYAGRTVGVAIKMHKLMKCNMETCQAFYGGCGVCEGTLPWLCTCPLENAKCYKCKQPLIFNCSLGKIHVIFDMTNRSYTAQTYPHSENVDEDLGNLEGVLNYLEVECSGWEYKRDI